MLENIVNTRVARGGLWVEVACGTGTSCSSSRVIFPVWESSVPVICGFLLRMWKVLRTDVLKIWGNSILPAVSRRAGKCAAAGNCWLTGTVRHQHWCAAAPSRTGIYSDRDFAPSGDVFCGRPYPFDRDLESAL